MKACSTEDGKVLAGERSDPMPGMFQLLADAAPFDGRIVMGGFCMEQERLSVADAIAAMSAHAAPVRTVVDPRSF